MAGSNNFKVFNENFLNAQSDADYLAEDQRSNGLSNGIAKTMMHNKLFRQVSIMAAAIGEFIKSQGNVASDNDLTALKDALAASVAPAAHLADTMPHRFVSGGITYRWGLAVIDGVVNMVYEEVV